MLRVYAKPLISSTLDGGRKLDLREFKFGIEIELIGRTRQRVAKAVHSVVGGTIRHEGYPDCYDPWVVTSADNREWKVMADSSLYPAPMHYQAEIVSPILNYEDIPMLQEIVRAVAKTGAEVSEKTGIHIHVDAGPFDGRSLSNLAKIVYKQELLIYDSLDVYLNRQADYAQPLTDNLIHRINQQRPKTKAEFKSVWYNDPDVFPTRFHFTRYHGLNLNSVYTQGTIEFRFANATLHAGRVKAYIQLFLALAAKAIKSRSTSSKKRVYCEDSAKYDFRVFLLSLGLIGPEFKTARYHLLSKLSGDSAFKNGRPKRQQALAA